MCSADWEVKMEHAAIWVMSLQIYFLWLFVHLKRTVKSVNSDNQLIACLFFYALHFTSQFCWISVLLLLLNGGLLKIHQLKDKEGT